MCIVSYVTVAIDTLRGIATFIDLRKSIALNKCKKYFNSLKHFAFMSYNLTCIIVVLNDTRRVSCHREEPVKKIWETWYFWFGVGLVFVLVVTSASSYLASSCKRKQQNLIRIRNPSQYREGVCIATTSGPGGIIQPDIQHFNNVVGVFPSLHITDLPVGAFACPLNPPYPAVEPVTIVRGSAPPQGFRQTNSYTEIVLPPGYVDAVTSNYKA